MQLDIDTSCLNAGVKLVIESDFDTIEGILLHGEDRFNLNGIDMTGIFYILDENNHKLRVYGWLGTIVEVNGVSVD
jgi:hypothetical protein